MASVAQHKLGEDAPPPPPSSSDDESRLSRMVRRVSSPFKARSKEVEAKVSTTVSDMSGQTASLSHGDDASNDGATPIFEYHDSDDMGLTRQTSYDSNMDDDEEMSVTSSTSTSILARKPGLLASPSMRKSNLFARMSAIGGGRDKALSIYTDRSSRFKIVLWPQEEDDGTYIWRQGAHTDLAGFAHRRSRWREQWRSRYFTLQGHRLFYSQSPTHNPHGMVDLSRCTRMLINANPAKLEIEIQHQLKSRTSITQGADNLTQEKVEPNEVVANRTRSFYMRFDDLDTLRSWEASLGRVVLEREGLDGGIQLPHEGPGFLNGEDVIREAYARKLAVSSSMKTWALRYLYLTATRIVYATDFGSENVQGEFVLNTSKTVRILAPDSEENGESTDPRMEEPGNDRIVNVTIQVPEDAGPQKTVKGTVMTSTGPHDVVVRIPEGAEPGSIVTVQVVVQFTPGEYDPNALANDRQVTISVGDNFLTIEFVSKKEALCWAREIRETIRRLDEDKLNRHIRQHEMYAPSPRSSARKGNRSSDAGSVSSAGSASVRGRGTGIMAASRAHRGGKLGGGRGGARRSPASGRQSRSGGDVGESKV